MRTPEKPLDTVARDASIRPGMSRHQRVEAAAGKIRRMFKLRRGVAIDSGAADSVMPKGWLCMFPARESPGSRAGLKYVAANYQKIANEGEQDVKFMSREGVRAQMTFQVGKVNKPLAAVSSLLDDGFRVVFDSDGSYILHKATNELMKVSRERGVFVLDAYFEQNPQ